MDILPMLRTLGALGVVLGMLAGALWAVRRYDIKLPGRVAGTGRKRIELVERLAVDGKRSVALIRRDGCEHLVLIGPDGHAVLETGIAAPPAPPAVESVPAKVEADLAAVKSAFGKLIELPRTIQTAQAKFATAQERARTPANDERAKAPANDALPDPAPRQRTRRPRDTKRWNRAAVREALNA
jgi:hypothetical protein